MLFVMSLSIHSDVVTSVLTLNLQTIDGTMASKPINEKDVFETYRSSYRVRFDWSARMKDKFRQWLSTFESSTNCPKTLVISSLLSMTGSLCGPGIMKVAVTVLYAVTKVIDS